MADVTDSSFVANGDGTYTRTGVEAVVYDIRDGKYYFLLLHRVLNWNGWEFPKGGIDAGEDAKTALLRELEEEAGLTNVKITKQVSGKKEWNKGVKHYSYDVFIVKANMSDPINLDQEIIEHNDFKWVAAEKVIGMLKHQDSKDFFKKILKELGLQ